MDGDTDGARETLPGEGALDDMRLGGWDEYAAARDRFFAQLARDSAGEPDDEEVSRRRRPASGSTCP